MTTHLTRARWVTAARVPLRRWRMESRPCRHPRPTPAVHSPAYLVAFARFPNKRFIAVGKFQRNVKDHLSMFLKLRFHILRCSRNGTFVRAFVNILSFLGLRQAAQCQRRTPHRLLMRPCWCLTGQDGPPPPPLRGRPHRLTAGRGAAVPAPARTVSGSVSYCRGPVRGEKTANFLQMHAKMYHFYSTEEHETRD